MGWASKGWGFCLDGRGAASWKGALLRLAEGYFLLMDQRRCDDLAQRFVLQFLFTAITLFMVNIFDFVI
ncbi:MULTISPECIES: hypothetical protein [unclassified Prochlorococcus]|uniref:hypothetical protein n=1 Tax=unclassified Prochlorococcus TaxID=2627481 RepID=UPI00053371E4|nr:MULTISPECIES: hypothetical protein [unclassified Prochlorococcus]KGG28372.1 hypothetical protein EV13_1614 [Prochlorococcus sp. MIT 0702]KGG28678.1 hypothetical protein EV12_0573 [Prochlorococcus sp. MIT 0701]KGG36322.1 hypothetical protein EV14_0416 [Prochlorococcus sp. MIT 0703]